MIPKTALKRWIGIFFFACFAVQVPSRAYSDPTWASCPDTLYVATGASFSAAIFLVCLGVDAISHGNENVGSVILGLSALPFGFGVYGCCTIHRLLPQGEAIHPQEEPVLAEALPFPQPLHASTFDIESQRSLDLPVFVQIVERFSEETSQTEDPDQTFK